MSDFETHPVGTRKEIESLKADLAQAAPIDMVLHCPKCGVQHIDGADDRKQNWKTGDRALTPHGVGTISRISSGAGFAEAYFSDLELPPGQFAVNMRDLKWPNEPHRSHLCHGCGHIWRPADVPTNGVQAINTRGKADSPVMGRAAPAQVAEAVPDTHGLSVHVGRDGVWLNFSTSTRKHLSINWTQDVQNALAPMGRIGHDVLRDWYADQIKRHTEEQS